jgi:hypothetical protein
MKQERKAVRQASKQEGRKIKRKESRTVNAIRMKNKKQARLILGLGLRL